MHKPYIIVIGNEKGGAGKTTIAMHLIIALLKLDFKVTAIDVDSRQQSLTSYLANRQKTALEQKLIMPSYLTVKESILTNKQEAEADEYTMLEQMIDTTTTDFIVIDTPGHDSYLSRRAHSYANLIITPINDSFIDFDVLAKINGNDYTIEKLSIYSQLVWEQKIQRAKRDGGSINWVITRNRLTNLDTKNKRHLNDALSAFTKRAGCKVVGGFSERVIFRELFLQGLTLLDLLDMQYKLSISHIAARQEWRNFLFALDLPEVRARLDQIFDKPLEKIEA